MSCLSVVGLKPLPTSILYPLGVNKFRVEVSMVTGRFSDTCTGTNEMAESRRVVAFFQ
jgi:hypothetical protein